MAAEQEEDLIVETTPSSIPSKEVLEGSYCRLELLSTRHFEELFELVSLDPEKYRYLTRPPPATKDEFHQWFWTIMNGPNVYYIVWNKQLSRYTGIQSYMRIEPTHRVIEIGDILWSSYMTRTRSATETIFLLLSYAFDELKYRRVEWKCDSKNIPSRNAALRFGFQFEGIFAQHMIIKGKNRDTAWFSIIDKNWNVLQKVYQGWLDASNFDEDGKQIQPMSYFHQLYERPRSGVIGESGESEGRAEEEVVK